ncbi:threonine synthase [Acidipila sp. EB88]|uniref:threonine synthase n=1 Tax=Acidipila sp. EB88 TaxID=2305226 RepID=UPI001F47D960|nr:threonine synthase [Acidipila sp. EB88]
MNETGATDLHQLLCTGCGTQAGRGTLKGDLRCECGDLYAVHYPHWSSSEGADRLSVQQMRDRWQRRRLSSAAIDQSGVWRFRDLLPIVQDTSKIITLREGNTPLFHLKQSGRRLGHEALYAKHQGMNPTGSFKDTGMTAALSVAHEDGFDWVACASTGNTSAAMAAYAARAGMRSLVLIPEGKIAWGKLSQSMDYGAHTFQLRTDFDGCVRVLAEVVRRAPVFLLNSVNPYRLEGQKTPAFEIAEAMNWDVPDHVIVPGGNLANVSALGKGFEELMLLGLTTRMPRLSVIQAEGANPLYRLIQKGADASRLEPVTAKTRASAIQIGNPASWRKALRILQLTDGYCEQVSEAELALAKAEIGREGIGCEPASAVTLAGFKKLQAAGRIDPGASVVLFLTGHTLKDSDFTIQYHRGELLDAAEMSSYAGEIKATQRNSELLDADADTILRAMSKLNTLDHAGAMHA